jgi:YVTN family beta-propeller protein
MRLYVAIAIVVLLASCEQESVRTVPPRLEVGSLFAINGDNMVTLGWTSPMNGTAASFEVHRSADADFIPSSSTLYATLPSTATRFVDTSVTNGNLFYYRLVPMAQLPNGSLQWGSITDVAIGKPMDYSTVTTIQYSEHIQSIFNSTCAVSGCHVGSNADDHDAMLQKTLHGNEQFSLKSWDDLVHGGPHGAVIIPFKASKSHLVFHVNTDTLVASVSLPHMPLAGFNLPAEQVRTLMRWIDDGAANDVGAIPFTVYPEGKVFVTNQAEDLVTVIDIATNLVARYIQAGVPNVFVQPPNAPHNITVDKQHGYYYVNLVAAGKVLKYRLSDDTVIGEVSGILSPTQVALSVTGDTAFVAQFASGTTAIRMFNTQTMQLYPQQIGSSFLNKPHGVQVTPDEQQLWVTGNLSDNILVVNLNDLSTSLIQLNNQPPGSGGLLFPYQTVMTSDNKYVYVSCQQSNEVRVIDRDSMKVVKVIAVGTWPLILAISPDDMHIYSANRNSNDVSVIRTSDNTVEATIANVGPNPHGIDLTDDGHYAYVSCENVTDVVPPHHPTAGSKIPGFVTVIDLATNQIVKTFEVGAFAAGVAVVQGKPPKPGKP